MGLTGSEKYVKVCLTLNASEVALLFAIKKYREEQGLTQAQLAEKSGVTRATIIALENNQTYITTTKTILNIARALGKSVGEIFFS